MVSLSKGTFQPVDCGVTAFDGLLDYTFSPPTPSPNHKTENASPWRLSH